MKGTRKRRWIALGADGRHVTLGHQSNPTDDELARLEAELGRQGIDGAWLVVAEGDYWKRWTQMTLLVVRSFGNPEGIWEDAVAAFTERRQASLQAA